MTIAVLEADLAKTKADASALLAQLTAAADQEANRELTPDETARLTAFTAQARSLETRIAKAKGDETMLQELDRLARVPASTATARAAGSAGAGRATSWGEQYVQSEAYAFHRAGGHRTAAAWRSPSHELQWAMGPGGVPVLRAATLTEDPASGGAVIVPQYIPGILPLPQAPLLIADLFAQGTTTSNLVTYMREKTWTNAANTVLEGAAKPESTLTFEAASDPVRKIAHWLPVSEEMLEDEPQIRSYIDARLRQGVLVEEQDQLMNGTGVAPDILGLSLRPGLAPPVAMTAPDTAADAILRQVMAVFGLSLLMPDAIVVNPVDWADIILTKKQTGDYYTGGPFSTIQTPTLWGLSVVVTPAIVAGTAMVGAFKAAAQVFRKGGVRVESSNSHQDFFIKNLVAIRAEERIALAVYRPSAFGKVTGI